MEEVVYDPMKPTLWIIRWQDELTGIIKNKFLAAFVMFFLPIILVGIFLQLLTGYQIFDYSLIIALLWLVVAPLIIQDGFYYLNHFFIEHKDLFVHDYEWRSVYYDQVKKIQSSKYLKFGIPWALITSSIAVVAVFNYAPGIIQLWAFISAFILFFISSIGFYVIYVTLNLMKDIFTTDVKFDLLHPDQFGGISDLGRFSIRISLYFSTGAFLFPLIFTTVAKLNFPLLELLIYIFFGFYILTLIASFIIPILQIKNFADSKKEELLTNSEAKLKRMFNDLELSQEKNYEKGMKIYLYYNYVHKRMLEAKTYPWDLGVILEFGLSLIIPIVVVLLQVYLG